MADHTEIREILHEALNLRVLEPGLNNRALATYVNTANQILLLLRNAGLQGLSTSQIESRSRMNRNTCKIYLRELRNLKLIESSSGKEAIWSMRKIG